MEKSIAIIQPYFFPYTGYFQLIHSVDRFVFYDDVKYITGGWINRNKILINGMAKYLTVPCKKASQNKYINEIKHDLDEKSTDKLLKSVKFSYNKAPFFESVFPILESVLTSDIEYISELAAKSVILCAEYLELDTSFTFSSQKYNNQELDRADRLIDICKQEGITNYINAIGGKEIYEKPYFNNHGIELNFLKPEKIIYEQFDTDFVPGLSILDVLMFNSPEITKNTLLERYKLV